MRPSPRWVAQALTLGTVLVLWGLLVWLTGGLRIEIAGVRLSSTTIIRPLSVGGILIALALARANAAANLLRSGSRVPAILAAALAILTFGLGIGYGTFVAGGPDPHGYVSQAALWRSGSLIGVAPYAAQAPWATPIFSPLGYVPGDRAGEIVPQYPPGLPILMAAFQTVAGEQGAYYVVPLAGALAIWLTFVFGRRLAGPVAGALASLTLFVSPVFLFQLMFPMSDVPATALWLLAAVLACRQGVPNAALSGLATTLAVMVRPNLVALGPAVLALIVYVGDEGRLRVTRTLAWWAFALVGPLSIALLQDRLYGSPLQSGYGATSGLYSAAYGWTNIQRYGAWLIDRQTPYILAGLLMVPLATLRGESTRRWLAAWALGFAALVVLCYIFYIPFDDWYFLRFLLPAFPMLLATAAGTIVGLAACVRARMAAAVVLVTVVGFCLSRADTAFLMREDQSRYRAAAMEASLLPEDAIVISNLHSGSIRYYASRLTARYEWIEPSDYSRTIAFLEGLDRPLFVMLDDLEVDDFKRRFQKVTDLSWLGTPVKIINGRVRLYALPHESG